MILRTPATLVNSTKYIKITGDTSLKKRDMKRIIKPLKLFGVKFQDNKGKLPIFIKGSKKEFSGPQFAQTLGSVFFDRQQYEVNFLKKSQNLRKNSIFQRFSSWLDQYI